MLKNKNICNIIVGAAVGATLGVLFVPQSGKETRKALKNKTDDVMTKIKNMDLDEVKENFENKIEELEQDLMDLDAEEVMDMAKKRIRKIKRKANELINMAKESGDDILNDAANEIKEKVIETAKNVIEKLEEE